MTKSVEPSLGGQRGVRLSRTGGIGKRACLRRQRRHSYQPRATPWVYRPTTIPSAESAIHRAARLRLGDVHPPTGPHEPYEAGRWPAVEQKRTETQGAALGWYEPGRWPEGNGHDQPSMSERSVQGAGQAKRDPALAWAAAGRFCVSPVPEGRLNPRSAGRMIFRRAFGRPFGTCGGLRAKPSVETLGYFRMSLRDEDRRLGRGSFRKALRLVGTLRASVAEVSNLLCRRLPVGRLYPPGRICGLEIRDTADWKSALRPPVGETREISGLGSGPAS